MLPSWKANQMVTNIRVEIPVQVYSQCWLCRGLLYITCWWSTPWRKHGQHRSIPDFLYLHPLHLLFLPSLLMKTGKEDITPTKTTMHNNVVVGDEGGGVGLSIILPQGRKTCSYRLQSKLWPQPKTVKLHHRRSWSSILRCQLAAGQSNSRGLQ